MERTGGHFGGTMLRRVNGRLMRLILLEVMYWLFHELVYCLSLKKKSKKEGIYQESIQSSTTTDPGYHWESDNVTIIHHKREPLRYLIKLCIHLKVLTLINIVYLPI